MYMSDEAFAFIDNFIYYLPPVMAIIFAVACLVFRKLGDKILHECADRLSKENAAIEVRQKTLAGIKKESDKKYYYNNCPNCGAKVSSIARSCSYCGTTLEVNKKVPFEKSTMHYASAVVSDPQKKIEKRKVTEGKDE